MDVFHVRQRILHSAKISPGSFFNTNGNHLRRHAPGAIAKGLQSKAFLNHTIAETCSSPRDPQHLWLGGWGTFPAPHPPPVLIFLPNCGASWDILPSWWVGNCSLTSCFSQLIMDILACHALFCQGIYCAFLPEIFCDSHSLSTTTVWLSYHLPSCIFPPH